MRIKCVVTSEFDSDMRRIHTLKNEAASEVWSDQELKNCK